MWMLGPNPGSLKELEVFLTAEPRTQPICLYLQIPNPRTRNKASEKANKLQGLHRGKTFRELRTHFMNHELVCGDDLERHPEV